MRTTSNVTLNGSATLKLTEKSKPEIELAERKATALRMNGDNEDFIK
jgi:hypothetical protein